MKLLTPKLTLRVEREARNEGSRPTFGWAERIIMKRQWRELNSESCPDCGSALEVYTASAGGMFDGDEVWCPDCTYRDWISVDERGNSHLQQVDADTDTEEANENMSGAR